MAIVVLIFFLCAVIFTGLFYLNADRFYHLHSTLKKRNNPLLKLIGFDEKDLQDRAAWIKHFRSYLILLPGILFLFFVLLFMKGH
jgi:hypothetical protein